MPMSPEKIKMFSVPESGSDLASLSPLPSQNEEEVRSKGTSTVNPASPPEKPNSPPNQEAHSDEKSSDDPSAPSTEEDPNPCSDLNMELAEETLANRVTCVENKSSGAEERHVGGGEEMASGTDEATRAASAVVRKLPAWASIQSAEDEQGRRCQSETQTKKKGNDLCFATNLQEVIEAFSGDFDEKKYAEMDILEVAEMKGITFENPSWWPPDSFPDSL